MTQDVVHLSVPAELGWVSIVRSTAVAVCSRVGYDLEHLEDIRLAVGEAAGLLAANAEPDSSLDVVMQVDGESVLITVTGSCSGAVLPREDSFAWAVLAALVVDLWAAETSEGISISLRTARATAGAEIA